MYMWLTLFHSVTPRLTQGTSMSLKYITCLPGLQHAIMDLLSTLSLRMPGVITLMELSFRFDRGPSASKKMRYNEAVAFVDGTAQARRPNGVCADYQGWKGLVRHEQSDRHYPGWGSGRTPESSFSKACQTRCAFCRQVPHYRFRPQQLCEFWYYRYCRPDTISSAFFERSYRHR